MPHKLKDILIKEISFVTKGASGDDKHAPKIIFWKGRPMPDKVSFIDRLKSVFSKADGEGGRTPEQMLEDLKSQLSAEQQDILMLLLAAAKASPPDSAAPAEPVSKPEPMDEEKMDEPPGEEMKKVLDENPKLAEHLAKIAAARKADREEIADLRKKADEQAAVQRRAKFEKAAQQYTWLPGDHADVAALWDEVDAKLSPESQETLASLIRATDGIVKKASPRLFEERGSSRSSETEGGTLERLEAMATEIVKTQKANGKDITIEKARALAMKDPKLRAELNQGRVLGQ